MMFGGAMSAAGELSAAVELRRLKVVANPRGRQMSSVYHDSPRAGALPKLTSTPS
jgi:hypothetical protein